MAEYSRTSIGLDHRVTIPWSPNPRSKEIIDWLEHAPGLVRARGKRGVGTVLEPRARQFQFSDPDVAFEFRLRFA